LLVAYFIYSERERLHQTILILLISVTFLGLVAWFMFHPALYQLPKEFLYLHRLNTHLGVLLLLSGLFFYITWSYHRAEIALEEERVKVEYEKKKSESLLYNILPVPVANRLRESHDSIADGFESATILFSDIVGFTSLSERMNPVDLVTLLNHIFSKFDQLVEDEGLEKIKTIGDAYMVASGLPINIENHAKKIAFFALDMQAALNDFNREQNQKFEIHSA
jgi:hypothetical protein